MCIGDSELHLCNWDKKGLYFYKNLGSLFKIMVILKIDRALYKVNDETRIYKYCGRNLDWKNLSKEENIKKTNNIWMVILGFFLTEERRLSDSRLKFKLEFSSQTQT